MSKTKDITSQAKVFAISAKLTHLANNLTIQPANQSADFPASQPAGQPINQLADGLAIN